MFFFLKLVALMTCFVSSDGLARVVSVCRELESLGVEELVGLSEQGLAVIGSLPTLKRVRLAYCKGLTDKALLAITQGCPDLTSLDLSYCNNPAITIKSIQNAINVCPKLINLSLRYTTALSLSILSIPILKFTNKT